ncbi:hypothetical protein GHK86_14325 [Acidimicrobiaceae bacterium USS-CC1]|uniref:Secreted protein n=1 Tax=Acidiferrimicrobium australe TaxID=2664430 RepID=A0ABW9QWF6_9ACTN|nr:hypothetical protein [Acidiferrimicrobium australe]
MIAVATALVLVFAAAAVASPLEVSSGRVAYHRAWTVRVTQADRCVRLSATGVFAYEVRPILFGLGHVWYHVVLQDPTVHASLHPYRGCRSRTATAASVHLSQSWSGYRCPYQPQLAANTGSTDIPACASGDRAEYVTSYGSGSTFSQYNSGAWTYFPGRFGNSFSARKCFGFGAGVSFTDNGVTTSAGSPPGSRVCLPG